MNHPSEQYCISLDGTHTEICRFAGLQDQNFIAVSGHLKRIVGEVRKYSRVPRAYFVTTTSWAANNVAATLKVLADHLSL